MAGWSAPKRLTPLSWMIEVENVWRMGRPRSAAQFVINPLGTRPALAQPRPMILGGQGLVSREAGHYPPPVAAPKALCGAIAAKPYGTRA